jgi:hypothetical protein
MPRFPVARFHVSTGPTALFERVRFKMRDVRVLKAHAGHVQDRAYEREARLDRLRNFDPDHWRLMTAEARTDEGVAALAIATADFRRRRCSASGPLGCDVRKKLFNPCTPS